MHKLIANNLIYKSKQYQLAIKIDRSEKYALAYDFIDEKIVQESEGILTTLDFFIAKEVEQSLEIDITDYGIEVIEEYIEGGEDIW